MINAKKTITKKVVESTKPGEVIWDTKIAGFGVRRQKTKPTYILKKRIRGRQRWITIGKHGEPWTPTSARQEAIAILGLIAQGKDPTLDRQARKGQPTVADLCDRYLAEHAYQHKKQSSIDADESSIRNHIKPLIGSHLVSEISIADVEKLKRNISSGRTSRPRIQGVKGGTAITGGKPTANRCLALLSKAFNLAIVWGLRSNNPASHVAKYREDQSERYLSHTEFAALGEALQCLEVAEVNPTAIAAIRLLIFTGARHREILNLRWSSVDLDNSQIFLDDSKTGRKPIQLNSAALEVLSQIAPQEGNEFVFCGREEGKPLINIRKVWRKTKEEATKTIWLKKESIKKVMKTKGYDDKITFADISQTLKALGITPSEGILDVRIHDLRHSFGGIAASSGISLPMIGRLLGHKHPSTTARYAHLADDPVKQMNEKIGTNLKDRLSGQNSLDS